VKREPGRRVALETPLSSAKNMTAVGVVQLGKEGVEKDIGMGMCSVIGQWKAK
jgi:CHASE1-domain containing sensor protein